MRFYKRPDSIEQRLCFNKINKKLSPSKEGQSGSPFKEDSFLRF